MECIEPKDCAAIDYTKEPSFDLFFPNLVPTVMKLEEKVDYSEKSTPQSRSKQARKLFRRLHPEIVRTVPMWDWLHGQKDGNVCIHTMRMMYCVLNDPGYRAADPRTQNVLKWTTLLHDIAKRGQMGDGYKDTAHPYYSGVEALRVLKALYNVKNVCRQCNANIKNLMQLIRDSVWKDKRIMLDRLELILQTAERIFGKDSFCFLVLKLVIMHQSLPAPPSLPMEYTNYVSGEMLKKIADKKYMKMLKVIVVNDLINYSMHLPEKKKLYGEEFGKHIDKLV